MAKRFIVDSTNVITDKKQIIVKGEEVHHINVLRYKVGDRVFVNEHEIQITKLDKDILEGTVVGELLPKGIPSKNITLIQSYLKSDKMDYVVQKAVELGVKNIIPVITKNTVVKMEEKDKIKKVDRLSKIAKEAVEQCGRTDTVNIEAVHNLEKVDFSVYDKVLVCHETSVVELKKTVEDIRHLKNIAVIIGPEGGLENSEVGKILQDSNATDISLGERILRAETASLAILSVLAYELN